MDTVSWLSHIYLRSSHTLDDFCDMSVHRHLLYTESRIVNDANSIGRVFNRGFREFRDGTDF